jgi:hypothetical protein
LRRAKLLHRQIPSIAGRRRRDHPDGADDSAGTTLDQDGVTCTIVEPITLDPAMSRLIAPFYAVDLVAQAKGGFTQLGLVRNPDFECPGRFHE